MTKYINPHTVSRSMQGGCPWGAPLERWHTYMLKSALNHLERGYFDRLRDAVHTELNRRRPK